MQVSPEQVRGGEKSNKKSNCSDKQRKIEHPPLFCQSVSSVKNCSKYCFLYGVQGPFYLTWLCKRFSLRPKGGECWGLDKVPRLPDGPCRTEKWAEEWRWSKVFKECLLYTEGRFVGVTGRHGRVGLHICLPVAFQSSLV